MLHTIFFFFFKGFIDRPFGWCVDLKATRAASPRSEVEDGRKAPDWGAPDLLTYQDD